MFPVSEIIHNIRAHRPAICGILQSPSQRSRAWLQSRKVSHYFATLCTINPACPVQLWDKFVPQLEATLNIMQTSRIDTSKSAYKALNGRKFNWNRTPLAPVSQKALAFLDQANCLTWAPHVINTFTMGFAPDYYQLLRFWNKLI